MDSKLYGGDSCDRGDVTDANSLQVDSWTRLPLTKRPKDLYVMCEKGITVDKAFDEDKRRSIGHFHVAIFSKLCNGYCVPWETAFKYFGQCF